jgi:PAS domain S-box-containing protein
MVLGLDGRIRFWNRAAEKLYGWSRKEAIGAVSHQLLKTECSAPVSDIEAIVARRGTWKGELSHQCKDGSRLYLESQWLLRRVKGQSFVIHLNTDISERKRNDVSQLYHAAIVADSDDAIIGKDLNGIVTTWNKSAETMFGWCASEIVGKPIATLFPPDKLGEEDHFLDRLRAGERIDHYETVRRRKDGKDIDVTVTISPIRAPNGEIIGASKIVRDISWQRRAEQHLRESQIKSEELLALLDTLLSSAPIGFAFIDLSYRFLRINDALAAIHGVPAEEHIGRAVPEFVPGLWAQIEPAYRRVLETGRAIVNMEMQGEIAVATGEARNWLVSHYPVRTRGEVIGIGVIVVDVTEQRRVEEQLRQSQKMEAIGSLTGGMAHDFNNLLGVIIGNLDMLHARIGNNAAAKGLASEALDAALRGADLTQRLLAFARRQPLRPVQIDINQLVASAVKLLSRVLGENVEISFSPADNVHPVVADRVQLEAALTNLATNARDAMPQGGRLMIATENRQLDHHYAAEHSEVTPGEYAMIEMTDTGTGIPLDVVGRIFEPFFTTKGQGEGTGLGLSMVFGFVKQSGGHVTVYSEPGAGSTFRLYLPRAIAQVSAHEADHEPGRASGGYETVLVVEDNPAMRRVVLRQLTELGYRVLEAENAAGALEWLQREHVDVLLTDIVMPGGVNGLELARAAAERWPALKILLTSGFPEARLTEDTTGTLGLRLLSKPYRKDHLARTLREVLDS